MRPSLSSRDRLSSWERGNGDDGLIEEDVQSQEMLWICSSTLFVHFLLSAYSLGVSARAQSDLLVPIT